MASYLGVEIGPNYIRAVELEGSAKKPVVRRFARLDLDATPNEEGIEIGLDSSVLSSFWKKWKFNREPSAAALNSLACTFREVDLPFTGHDQIRKVIKYEAENHIPQEDVDDLVVSYRKLGLHRDKSRLMIVAARKDRVLEHLGSLQATGVDPYHLELDLTALFNAASGLGLVDSHERLAIVNCEEKFSSVLIVEKGEILLARTMRIGFGASNALAAPARAIPQSESSERADSDEPSSDVDLLVDGDPEEDLLILADGPDDEPHGDFSSSSLAITLSDSYLRRLDREMRRLLTAAPLSEPVERVYLVGRGSHSDELGSRFSELFQAPSEPWDILDSLSHKLPESQLEIANQESAVAIGAALKLMGHDRGQIDLRQEECGYAKKFDQIKVPLTSMLVMVFVFVALFNIYYFRRLGTLKLEEAAIEKAVNSEYDAYGDPEKPLSNELKGLKRAKEINKLLSDRREELMSSLGRSGKVAGLPSAPTALAHVTNAMHAMKDDIGPIFIKSFEVDVDDRSLKRTVTLDGIVESNSNLTTLVEAFNKNPDLMSAPIEPRSNGAPEGRIEFKSLEIIIVPGEITE